MDLKLSGYHPEGIGFFIRLENASYSSKYIDGVEEGSFKLSSMNLLDV